MSTIADRLRYAATQISGVPRRVAEELEAIAAELEAAPAADAVPVVAYLYEDPYDKARYAYAYESTAIPLEPQPCVRQSDHLSAIAALQRQLGECDAGYRTMEREVAALRAQITAARPVTDVVQTAPFRVTDVEGGVCVVNIPTFGAIADLRAQIAALQARIAELEARQVPDDALGKLIDIAAHHFTEGRYGWPSKWTHEKMIQHWRDGKQPVPDVFAPSNPTTQPPEGR